MKKVFVIEVTQHNQGKFLSRKVSCEGYSTLEKAQQWVEKTRYGNIEKFTEMKYVSKDEMGIVTYLIKEINIR